MLATALPLAAQTGITAVLPNGREIHPAGNWIALAPYPFSLAVRPDERTISIPSIGFPFALNNVVDGPAGSDPTVRRIPADQHNNPAIQVHAGLASHPMRAYCFTSRPGDSGKICAYHTGNWQPAGEISLDGPLGARMAHAAATLVISADGATIYALDQANWRVVILDAHKLRPIASIPTGSYPFGIALSPDGARLYVTDSGLFEYKTIPGVSAQDPLGTGLHFLPLATHPERHAKGQSPKAGESRALAMRTPYGVAPCGPMTCETASIQP